MRTKSNSDVLPESSRLTRTLANVKNAIQNGFPGTEVIELTEEHHKVVGTIVWKGFKGKNPTERHHLITEKVRNRLGSSAINVGILFPLAPGETL